MAMPGLPIALLLMHHASLQVCVMFYPQTLSLQIGSHSYVAWILNLSIFIQTFKNVDGSVNVVKFINR